MDWFFPTRNMFDKLCGRVEGFAIRNKIKEVVVFQKKTIEIKTLARLFIIKNNKWRFVSKHEQNVRPQSMGGYGEPVKEEEVIHVIVVS